MPYDGAGNYSLPVGSIVVDGTPIDAADHNVPVSDIATALSQALLRSGVAPMTGNLDMAGFAVINAGGSNPVLGGDNTWTGANTWSGANIMTTAASSGIPLELVSTSGDGIAGPSLSLYRNSPSPAFGDYGPEIKFFGKDSVGQKTAYAAITCIFSDVTNGTEDAGLIFYTMQNGSIAARALLGGGLYYPGVTGGDKGVNTINFGAVYVNGAAVPTLAAANTWTATNTWTTRQDIILPADNIALYVSKPGSATLPHLQLEMPTYSINYRFATFTVNGGNILGQIAVNSGGSGVSYLSSSDGRLKPDEHRHPIADSGAVIDALNPLRFRWDNGSEDFGFVAQEVAEVLPQVVRPGDDDPKRRPGDDGYEGWAMAVGRMEPILVAEVKALRARVASLEAHLEALEARIDAVAR